MSENTPRARRSHTTAILLVAAAALPLPPAWAAGCLAALAVLWLGARPPRRERVAGGAGLGLAALLSLAPLVAELLPAPSPAAWRAQVERGYGALLDELAAAARRAASDFGAVPAAGEPAAAAVRSARPEQFARLHTLAAELGTTLVLLDPDGEAVAWAGPGLLHELEPYEIPAGGFAYRRGYTAVTLYAIEPLGTGRRPWRLLAGRSHASDELPFATAAVPAAGGLRWSVAAAAETAPPGVVAIEHPGAPALFVDRPRDLVWRSGRAAADLRRLGAALLGLALLTVAVLRLPRLRLLPVDARRPQPPGPPLLTAAGSAVLGAALGLQPATAVALGLAAAAAAAGLGRRRRSSVRSGGGAVLGAAAFLVPAVAAAFWQDAAATVDLGSYFVGTPRVAGSAGLELAGWTVPGPEPVALRLAGALLALGLLTLAARRRGPELGDRPGWTATLFLLLAAAGHDLPLVALPLLALGGVFALRWLGGVDFERRPAAVGGLILLAALAGATAWETAYRDRLRNELETRYLPRLAPPTKAELDRLYRGIYRWFQGRDVARWLPPVPGPVDPQDLAFVLWRDSPLPERDGLSALVVRTADGRASSFTFGLALDQELRLSLPRDRWSLPSSAAWQTDALLTGEAVLERRGERWGTAEFWFLPRPGFRLEATELDELEAALIRGKAKRQAADGLPRAALYALYDAGGKALSSPWEEAPPLAPALVMAADRPRRAATPAGLAWVFLRRQADGVVALYLPVLGPLAGLERVGIHALGALLWVAAAIALGLILALPRSRLRELFRRTVRSYSKRLILVYAALLLLPLVALNLVLMRSFENRLQREERAHAQEVMAAARLFLLDFLRGLGPGFDLNTQVNRDLMEWISSVVQHQVTLYWGSRVYVSSQQELFTAGLVPKRIPGEIFSRLALLGYEMDFRVRRQGELTYLELYAPLDVEGGLFLSVPLLEQEEGVARELAVLRRRAILVSSALVALLVALGSRLARGFTKPLMELVGGTERIAAGAQSLDVTPREEELSALADAIDDMARRIAVGRQKLVNEKQVVERIVANIASGVVSLDRRRRVLLQNRVAADFLGTEVGRGIDEALERDERLLPVAEFLRAAGAETRQQTLRIAGGGGEPREWTFTWVPIPGAEDPAALLVVDDATEVLRAQRLEAWAEMARIIAHEIKNPLTPIRLSAEHMRQVYRADRERFDEVFERCTGNILAQVDELRDIASDFSIYSRIPRAEPRSGDLVATLRELLESYRDAVPGGVEIVFATGLETLRARFDDKLLGRAVRNLLENALRASAGSGRVELALEQQGDRAIVRVTDSGPGVEPEILHRIFEPYFSTYDSGTGLGLAITRRIVEEHGGSIEARNRAGGGLAVTITLPLGGASLEYARS